MTIMITLSHIHTNHTGAMSRPTHLGLEGRGSPGLVEVEGACRLAPGLRGIAPVQEVVKVVFGGPIPARVPTG